MKEGGQAIVKFIERLDVAVRPVYLLIAMVKINIRHDECAVVLQDSAYVIEFLTLVAPNIFKDALGQDNVKLFVATGDRGFKEVSLN
jgi:hypothetical protein